MIKKYLVFEVEVRTDGEKHEVGIKDVTEKVVVINKDFKYSCEDCLYFEMDPDFDPCFNCIYGCNWAPKEDKNENL